MINIIKNYLFVVILSFSFFSQAYTNKSYYVGIGYQLDNNLGKMTKSDTGSGSFLGTANYPLIFRYDMMLGRDTFFSPRLTYTLFPRGGSSSTVKSTQWHIMLPFGQNFSRNTMDWSVGLGILNRS